MEMCYENQLILPREYVIVDANEMMYLDGGGTATISINGRISSGFKKLAISLGIGVLGSIVTTALVAALAPTVVGELAVPAIASFLIGFIGSYFLDTNVKNDSYFSVSKSMNFPVNAYVPIYLNLSVPFE